jgi:hypothetical protein
MTKSDYELVAKTIRAHFAPKEGGDFGDMEEQTRQEISLALGLAFEQDYAENDTDAFVLTQFLKECEPIILLRENGRLKDGT